MKHWTIGQRIITGFAAILAVTLAIGAFSFSRLRVIQHHSDSLTTDSLPGVAVITNVQANARDRYALVEKALLTTDPARVDKALDESDENNGENSKLLKAYEDTIHAQEDRELFAAVNRTRGAYAEMMGNVTALCRARKKSEALALFTEKADEAFQTYDTALQKLVDYNRNSGLSAGAQISAAITASIRFIIAGAGLALLVAAGIAFFIIRDVNRTLRTTTGALEAGAEQVTAAAHQVSASSQTLAEGASEQAASLEETSASLEEVSSMSKRNAENAQQTKDLASQTRAAADAGAADMEALNHAMADIKASSHDIAKIIKSIDEIAFQTNILALNAAVEAARAGEAGQGFAVVADEVRSLAQRSAQSAKETAAQIEVAIARSDRGVAIFAKVAQSLTEIVQKTRRVDALVSEIAAASHEQTQGVAQVNGAVGQMDKVTQGNASSAEEAAAAAEELNSQSLMMRDAVGELISLVGARQSADQPAPASRLLTANRPLAPGHPNGKASRLDVPLVIHATKHRNGRNGAIISMPVRNRQPVDDLHFQDS